VWKQLVEERRILRVSDRATDDVLYETLQLGPQRIGEGIEVEELSTAAFVHEHSILETMDQRIKAPSAIRAGIAEYLEFQRIHMPFVLIRRHCA
jgi:hypothetical protein